MKQLRSHLIGIDQGDVALFSDFEDGGQMWTGTGTRERRKTVGFSRKFRAAPSVTVTVSLWDVDTDSAVRMELSAEDITDTGFEIVFRTWLDTRIARLRVAWTAIGELANEDDWDIA
ncbi:MAG: H-type lectin domain-containing protein [Jhaorihella sp.]